MRKIFAIIIAFAMVNTTFAMTFDEGYREQDRNGHYYLSDHHEHVLICGGYLLVPANSTAKCPDQKQRSFTELLRKGMKKFRDRINSLK